MASVEGAWNWGAQLKQAKVVSTLAIKVCSPAAESPGREAAQTGAGTGFYSGSLFRIEQDLEMWNQSPALGKGSDQAWAAGLG